MEQLTGLTIAEVLSLVPQLKLLAGADGARRVVRSVGVMETQDLFPLIKQGDLILTGLYAVKDDPEAQLSVIPELHRRGAAGLAVKLRYLAAMPPKMLEQAKQLAFPLFELEANAAYSDVLQPIFGQIVNRQAALLSRQQQAHRMVMKAVLEGRGLQNLVRKLSELLENPVVILGESGDVLAAQTAGAHADLDLETLARREASGGEYLVSGGEALHRRDVLQAGGHKLSRLSAPVLSGEHAIGQVVVWEVGRPVQPMDLSIIDAVSPVVALEIANQRALVEVERRYKGEFLEALFAREIESELALIQRGRTFGWDLGRAHFAVALQAAPVSGQGDAASEEVQRAREHYLEVVAKAVGHGMVGQVDRHIVALIAPRAKAQHPKEEALLQAQGLLALAEPFGKSLRVTAGVGRVHTGVHGLRKSFEEAARAVSVGAKVWGPGAAYHYDDLGLYQILSMLEPNADVQQFLSAIDKLVAYEKESRTELIQTLETYFACKGNVRKVSERLYAHYNTVLYRLERIQQITGIPLEDATGRLHLQVALQAARLFGRLPSAAGH